MITLLASSLAADTLRISSTGFFTSILPTSAFTAPNTNYSFSFLLESHPAVSNVMPREWFDVAFTNFDYRLNASPVAVRVADIRFFSNADFGFFDICFHCCPRQVLAL
jgi:hypothetical protein